MVEKSKHKEKKPTNMLKPIKNCKYLRLASVCILLTMVVALSACAKPAPAPEEIPPTPTPAPTLAPTHISPSGGATGVSTKPTFQWQGVSSATFYGLYISKPPYGEANLAYENESVTGTSLSLPISLEEGVTYRWNMRAGNSAGWGPFSSSWSFTTLVKQAPTSAPSSISDITINATAYDGKTVEVSGQAYLTGSPPRLLIDGKRGINLSGNTATLEKAFYRLTGDYNAGTNTLDVTDFAEQEVKYLAIEEGEKLGSDLVPVTVQGLVATPPKEVANMLTSYISIPKFPEDVPIYSYVVYAKDRFYLVLSDGLIYLPAKFTILYEGKDYSFTFSAGEVTGTLVRTPITEIDFGPRWQADEFRGVIIANKIAASQPIEATVKGINADPGNYIFRRVSIVGDYVVTTATVDYSDIKAPMGQGILADKFSDFFKEDTKLRLETLDPNRKVWQLRRGQVIGTIIYPTEQILRYLDYSSPLSKSEIKERLKPALIVDTLKDEVVKVADISELNPVTGEPSKYWDKVVEFDGYALGINYPLKRVAEAILGTEVPLNVNLLAIGIADKPDVGSQLAIVGLNNELIDENGQVIKGRFKFSVAVTHVPEELVSGIPYADTAFFLLNKEELPIEVPKVELYSLKTSINPSGAGSVTPPEGEFQLGSKVTLTAVAAPGYEFDYWGGDALGTSPTITITMDSDKSITAHFKPATLISIELTPGSVSIEQGKTQQFSATATYSDGSTKDITTVAIWASSAPSVATVSPTGLVTGLSQGTATISASLTIQGSATLTVTLF